MNRYRTRLVSFCSLIALGMGLSAGSGNVGAQAPQPAKAPALAPSSMQPSADSAAAAPKASHRLIVELESAPLANWARVNRNALQGNGRLNLKSAAAQTYLARLRAEQADFVSRMTAALPAASVGTFVNELGVAEQASYQIVFNGLSVDPGTTSREAATKALLQLPGVKSVSPDYAHQADLYTSNTLINSAAAWDNVAIGGRGNAGAGIKLASMDGGVHKDAPMFSGAGYSYPAGYPANGLGQTANNNGKIIASRSYFRPWDMPSAGDENPWPGVKGTSHGVHTAGIAAGNNVNASILGLPVPNTGGVASRAWVMSYRVFYNSVTNDGSFYNTEGIAALEDIVADQADVVNNSWGGGPSSSGGEYDALDTALINASASGVFVSMSAGNAGPNNGTTDHPSDEYIVVGASTTAGTFAAGRIYVTQPTPISPTLQGFGYGTGAEDFGAPLPIGTTLTKSYLPAAVAMPSNTTGCAPFPAGTFNGTAALIERGGCEFGVKAVNAQAGGADFVVIYNNPANGESLLTMAAGAVGAQYNGIVVQIGRSKGLGMLNWYNQHGAAARFDVNTVAYQAGNTPDVMASFSSRGPAVGNTLSPDITAPGVNILSQGYDDLAGADGEDRHLGFGQVSGTSMASPHVAGAAALLRQIHPTWSNDYIKSALMSTSKYLNIFNHTGTAAQPLDMGAGRLDLTNAADPGVILDPPSLSYGLVVSGTTKTIQVNVTNITNVAETYNLSTLYTGAGFNNTTSLPGFSVSPSQITLAPGASTLVSVTFTPAAGRGYGDNQGYIIMDGTTHDAHMPAWGRVTYAQQAAEVLVIDNDASSSLSLRNYSRFYTEALELKGYTYDVLDVDDLAGSAANFIPALEQLLRYKTIVYFTGDNYEPNGTYNVPTPMTDRDQDRLTEYANSGGHIVAMGQDLAAVLGSADTEDGSFFYQSVLAGKWLNDSVTGFTTPTLTIVPNNSAPLAFQGIELDLGGTGDGAHNQLYIDELNPLRTGEPGDTEPAYFPLLRYPTADAEVDGTVAVGHRDIPTLERPGITFPGSTVYAAFGLEGVNNLEGRTSRADLLDTFIQWGLNDVNFKTYLPALTKR